MKLERILKENCLIKDGNYISKIDSSLVVKVGQEEKMKFLERVQITESIQSIQGVSRSCLGFCPRRQQWYGWSEKDLQGFDVGAIITSNSFLWGGRNEKAHTLAEARKMAERFAKHVASV